MTCSLNGQNFKSKAPRPCVIIRLLVSYKRLLQIYLRRNKRLTFHSPLTTDILQCSRPLILAAKSDDCLHVVPPDPRPQKDSLEMPQQPTVWISHLPSFRPPVCSVRPTVCLQPRRLQDTGRTASDRVGERNGIKQRVKMVGGTAAGSQPKAVFHCRLSWQVLTGPRWQTGCSPVTTSPRPVCQSIYYKTNPTTPPAPPKLPTANMIQSKGGSNERKPKQTQELLV